MTKEPDISLWHCITDHQRSATVYFLPVLAPDIDILWSQGASPIALRLSSQHASTPAHTFSNLSTAVAASSALKPQEQQASQQNGLQLVQVSCSSVQDSLPAVS